MNKWMHACMMKIIWKSLRVGEKITNCRRFSKIILQCPSLSIINMCKLVFANAEVKLRFNNMSHNIRQTIKTNSLKCQRVSLKGRYIATGHTAETLPATAVFVSCEYNRKQLWSQIHNFFNHATLLRGETAVNSYKTSWGSACCL